MATAYQTQIDWCDNTISQLDELEYSLKSTIGTIDTTMEVLQKALFKEDFDEVHPFKEEFRQQGVKLYNLIHSDNKKFIETQKKYLIVARDQKFNQG